MVDLFNLGSNEPFPGLNLDQIMSGLLAEIQAKIGNGVVLHLVIQKFTPNTGEMKLMLRTDYPQDGPEEWKVHAAGAATAILNGICEYGQLAEGIDSGRPHLKDPIDDHYYGNN